MCNALCHRLHSGRAIGFGLGPAIVKSPADLPTLLYIEAGTSLAHYVSKYDVPNIWIRDVFVLFLWILPPKVLGVPTVPTKTRLES